MVMTSGFIRRGNTAQKEAEKSLCSISMAVFYGLSVRLAPNCNSFMRDLKIMPSKEKGNGLCTEWCNRDNEDNFAERQRFGELGVCPKHF